MCPALQRKCWAGSPTATYSQLIILLSGFGEIGPFIYYNIMQQKEGGNLLILVIVLQFDTINIIDEISLWYFSSKHKGRGWRKRILWAWNESSDFWWRVSLLHIFSLNYCLLLGNLFFSANNWTGLSAYLWISIFWYVSISFSHLGTFVILIFFSESILGYKDLNVKVRYWFLFSFSRYSKW